MTLLLLLALAACGGGSRPAPPDAPAAESDAGDGIDVSAELEPLPLGLPAVEGYAYAFGPGQRHFRPALAARARGDWKAVRAACEAALAADPGHLEAHRTLASALAALGETRGVAKHLSLAWAGDFMRFGAAWERDKALAAYLDGPHGAALRELAARYRGEYVRRVQRGLLVVARREPRRALRAGAQDVLLRAEIYAWDAETTRWLRVSRTNQAVAAFVRAPAGDLLAFVAFGKVRVDERGAATLLDARVGAVELPRPAMSPRNVRLGDAPAVRLEVDGGGRLWGTTGDLLGGDRKLARTWQLDVGTGKAKPMKAGAKVAGQARQVIVSAGDVIVVDPSPEGIEADWDAPASLAAAAGAFRLAPTRKTVTLPSGEYARRASFVWSPGGARVAFVTAADPCAEATDDRVAELAVVDAATGRWRIVARGQSRFHAVWLDDDRLAYDDGAGAVRVIEAADAGKELAVLAAPGGVGVFGIAARPTCAAEAAGAAPAEVAGDDADAGIEELEEPEL